LARECIYGARNVPFEIFPVILDVVLTVAPVYLTSHCGGAVVVGQVLCFATPSSNFMLSGRRVEIDLVSYIESFVFNLCDRLAKVVCVHALVPL
jgi:hypothetical protein